MLQRILLWTVLVTLPTSWLTAAADAQLTQQQAREHLRKSVTFYREQVGYQGAYLYHYSADLTKQEGEHEASRTTGWTQPPGTPSVGAAYLEAYLLTAEPYLLEAAEEVADALIRGQLRSGGWYYKFELAEPDRSRYAYRIDSETANGRNYTTLDDNKTQSAVTFLMHLDEATGHEQQRLSEAARYALDRLVAAQFPNGAWPQQFDSPPQKDRHPVMQASLPQEWSRVYSRRDYRDDYTLNDNALTDTMVLMLEAHRIYGDARYLNAAKQAGEFMVLAQLPEPQPGWAQQYNASMHPAWARKFEPPAVTGGESQGVMRALLRLYDATGEERYLGPLHSAIVYYRRSALPDGRLARFYEMGTNRPLYFTKQYKLTYDDTDLPTHYSFKVASRLDSIEMEYQRLRSLGPSRRLRDWRPVRPRLSRALGERAAVAIDTADERGAWVETGVLRTYGNRREPVITMRTYIRNLGTVAQFIGAL